MLLALASLAALLGGPPGAAPGATIWSADAARSSVVLSVSRLFARPITARIPIASASVVTTTGSAAPLAVQATLNAGALRSDDARRDEQLRSSRFFDVARYPVIDFLGDRVTSTGSGAFRIEGRLTMRGITRPLTFDATLASVQRAADGRARARYLARARFRRSEFGMTYGKGIVGDNVTLQVVLETAVSPRVGSTSAAPSRDRDGSRTAR
ncbi:MAG TPA: YceI family protein [Candidatus Limnocylindria bacterium]|nr:YceI family protein [Candidatus Limnocylindria bacterium]